MKVLITGSAGFIGSTVVNLLQDNGYQTVGIDSLVHGRREFLHGHTHYVGDIDDGDLIERIFYEHPDIQSVIHFAAHIDVAESMTRPLHYYRENLSKSISFLEFCLSGGVRNFIYSSTAAVYDETEEGEGVTEESRVKPLSPYGQSKWMFEQVLHDVSFSGSLSSVVLRYFNLIGADPSLRSGPYKSDPSHILGKLVKSLDMETPSFIINGKDYTTRDGTTIRDYVHVWDLAHAHLLALEFASSQQGGRFEIFNIGSGSGYTVLEFAETFRSLSFPDLKLHFGNRRSGDLTGTFAINEKAKKLLSWYPRLNLEDGIRHALLWEEKWKEHQTQMQDENRK